jgi:hypothetical protein
VSETERFEPGRAIVHRDLQHGRIWYARAEIVVKDREERLLTYWPPGAEIRLPAASDGGAQVRLPTSPWILRPGDPDPEAIGAAWGRAPGRRP